MSYFLTLESVCIATNSPAAPFRTSDKRRRCRGPFCNWLGSGVMIAIAAAFAPIGLAQSAGLPKPDHVVIVIEENHPYLMIIKPGATDFINNLAMEGALLTNAHAVGHPSQPNYYAIFAGKTFGLDAMKPEDLGDKYVGHRVSDENLASELAAKNLSFAAFEEGIPKTGYRGGNGNGGYAQRHNPWGNFSNVKDEQLVSEKAFFPDKTKGVAHNDYASLPTISFLIPTDSHDMHDPIHQPLESIGPANTWLENHVSDYVQWAKTNNSLLLVTMDEADYESKKYVPNIDKDPHKGNHIPTIFVGPMVKAGARSDVKYTLYSILRTLEDMYGLSHAGNAEKASPITDIWK